MSEDNEIHFKVVLDEKELAIVEKKIDTITKRFQKIRWYSYLDWRSFFMGLFVGMGLILCGGLLL